MEQAHKRLSSRNNVQSRISAGMGITNYRHALQKRYSKLTGQLEDVRTTIDRINREVAKLPGLEAVVPRLVTQIEAVTLLLSEDDPDWTPEETPAIQPWSHTLPVPFGTCGRRAMNALRLADGPRTVRQLALEVLRDCGSDSPDKSIVQKTCSAIEASFRKQRGRTVISSGKYPAQWRPINKPDLLFGP